MAKSLSDWLRHIESQHSEQIVLTLDRVNAVRIALCQATSCPVIVIGGTNGKGSVCAMLESVLLSAGYRVGLYTSPHFLRYNERVRINGVPANDEALCNAFESVEGGRDDIPLTYFEFGTLAAWEVFSAASLDVIILEVGLGGRLDAVNIYDPDCAVVTTVDMDHMDFLGSDRQQIGFEKAGIFRSGKPAIFGDVDPPKSLIDYSVQIGADLKLLNRDFGFILQEQQWRYWGWRCKRSGLAHPALRGSVQLKNASIVLAVLDCFANSLPVAMQDVRRGLMAVELPGRFQLVPGRPAIILDVSHNPQAVAILAQNMSNMAFYPETWAVFGIMADKDIAGVIRAIKDRVTRWLVCTLKGNRAADAAKLAKLLREEGITDPIYEFISARDAFNYALSAANENDRILAFGSFLTVAEAMQVLAPAIASRA